jgi:NADH-quinone oxidoreductase subunit L
VELFSGFLAPVLPPVELRPAATTSTEWLVQGITMVLTLGGIYLAYYFYRLKPEQATQLKTSIAGLHNFWLSGWGFDALYNTLIVRPYVYLAAVNKRDVVDNFYSSVVSAAEHIHRLFATTQGGILRWYIMSMVIGAILILTLGLLL